MFRCEICGSTVPAHTRAQRIVLETRPKRYPARPEVFRVVTWIAGKRKVTWKDDPGGIGDEIVREVLVCPACSYRAG
jgi:hypothetical protein